MTHELPGFEKSKVAVYFCGGTGLNIGKNLTDLKADIAFIDTSDRNLTEAHESSKVFLTKNTVGAGKNRGYILPIVRPQVPNILTRFPAADFNIVVFGTSGGSGNILGSLLVSEMLKANETVVVIGVSGIESTEVVDNSLDAIKTLEGISHRQGRNILLTHILNGVGVPFSVTNDEAEYCVRALCDLSSQEHQRLDVKDIENWVNFSSKAGIQPQLCELRIFDNRKDASTVNEMLSVASLYTDEKQEVPFGSPFVTTTGIAEKGSIIADQLHFVVNSIGIEEIVKSLEDIKQESHRQQSRYRQRNSTLDIDDNQDDDGFVV